MHSFGLYRSIKKVENDGNAVNSKNAQIEDTRTQVGRRAVYKPGRYPRSEVTISSIRRRRRAVTGSAPSRAPTRRGATSIV